MTDIDAIEAKIRDKIDLSDATVRSIMSPANIDDFVNFRLYETLMTTLPRDELEALALESVPSAKEGWPEEDWDPINLQRVSKPASYGINRLYYIVKDWWLAAHPGDGWHRPKFENHADYGAAKQHRLMVAADDRAKLFLAVAKALDSSYTASNCNAACDAAKQRSYEGKEKRREQTRKHVRAYRAGKKVK